MPEIDVNLQLISVIVPDGHDEAKPIPLALKSAAEEEANIWATGDGGRLYGARDWAEKSMEMDSEAYKEQARARMMATRLMNATILDSWSGWVSLDGDEDDYFASPEELLQGYRDNAAWCGVQEDQIEQQLPAWCFATTESTFDFDLESAIDSYLDDNHHEEARDRLSGFEEILEAFHQWAQKQTITTYFIDYTRIVVLDRERFVAARAEARGVLAAEAANG